MMMNGIHSAPVLPPMIDTHCHLDDHQFESDLEYVISASRTANVRRWILIGYDPVRWPSAIALSASTDGMYHSLGVHPALATVWDDTVAQRLRQELVESKAVAVGEAGLDFYRDNAPLDIQEPAFVGQLRIAAEIGLPLIIHMRDANADIIRILRSEATLPRLVFHSFDGSTEVIDFVIESQSWVGIGGLATRQKSSELREMLARVPSDRLLLETDSPYLVPAKQKDRRNQPSMVAVIATMMAETLETTPEELARTTTANAEHLFGLPHD